MTGSEETAAVRKLIAGVADLLDLALKLDAQAVRVLNLGGRVDGRVARINEQNETLASRVEELAARINQLESSDRATNGAIDRRITCLASRMLRMEELEKALSRPLDDLASLVQRVEGLAAPVAANLKDLGELRTQVNGLGAQVGSLGGDRHNTQALLETYQERVAEYEDRVKIQSNYIAELKTKQRTAEAAHLELIDAMSKRIGKLEEEITAWGARDS